MTAQKLGDPCWDVDRIADVITNIAKMDASRAHDFLASHSPIRGIRDERKGSELTEEDLFRQLSSDKRHETLAVIYGEPGTGKSHLVHWLKLRFEHGVQTGEVSGLVSVLIQRRTGSLKDALDQIVRQLPQEFGYYLEPVRQALGKISNETARATLAAQLALELDQRWLGRERPPLPMRIKAAAELCRSQGFREWLCRDGGVIARNVSRLVERSDVEDRESLPLFSADEFRLIRPEHRTQNTPSVRDLIDEIVEYDEVPQILAKAFNQALPDAIRELSGLGQGTLPDIFESIRRDLCKQGRGLAIFIEDVSVMSELDHEVLRAVEPRARPELGRMVAVLGMTQTGKGRLRPNELGRVTHLASVGTAVEAWRESADEVARFAARYLNLLRLDDHSAREVAAQRRDGSDVRASGCSKCPVQQNCHDTFGAVKFEGTPVGLFPLTVHAARRLLSSLDTHADGVRINPRGFLDHVLRPLVVDTASFEEREFPRPQSLPVRMPEPAGWTAFEAGYCGNWDSTQRARLKFFAQGWVEVSAEDDRAAQLAPFLAALGLPAFSQKVKGAAPRPPGQPPEEKPWPGPPPPPQRAIPTALQKILDDLADWCERGKTLSPDDRPRELVLGLVRKCFPVEDVRDISGKAFDTIFDEKSVIRFEGQRSQPANRKIFLDLPRSEESKELVAALAHYEYLGNKTWSFPHGEVYKRVVSRWLRRNHDRIVRTCCHGGPAPREPIRAIAELLVVAATVRRGRPLRVEEGYSAIVREALAEFKRPVSLTSSGSWTTVLTDLDGRHRSIRELALEELDVPQGSGKVNFIDPLPFVEAVRSIGGGWSVAPLAPEYHAGFWQARYASLAKWDALTDLPSTFAPERAEMAVAVRELRQLLDEAGYAGQPLDEAVKAYFTDLREVEQRLKKDKNPVPDEEYDREKQQLYERSAAFGRAVVDAQNAVDTEGVEAVLSVDADALGRARAALRLGARYAAKVADTIERATKAATAEGDPLELERRLLSLLAEVAGTVSATPAALAPEGVEP